MASRERGRESLLVVAIDFGTSYSGYAYQFYNEFVNDPNKIGSPQAWNSGKSNLISLKTPTCLLLNQDKALDECAFGYEAEERYANLCLEQENEKYYFFRRFKMKLQEGEGLTKSSTIEDETGKKMLALDVFALSIKCLKNHLMKMLEKQGTGVGEEDIFWVLTVPAIWNDAAKQFMRKAAILSGIKSDNLEIALEPEVASIFCQHVPVSSISSEGEQIQFAAAPPGTKYMVVDLGGGTADITVHEKLERGKLKEICKASGGPWGGTAVDNAFLQMLISIVGGPLMSRFMKEETYDYLDLFREFEAVKRNFSKRNKNKIVIKLPVTLNELCEEILGSNFKTCLAESVHSDEISLRADKMIIDPKLMDVLFRKATDPIIDHLCGILDKNSENDISLILMIGGFSESPFVQDVIREAFHGKNGRKVVIPKDAGITIVKGAVLFGRMPDTIDTRVLRFTYGVKRNPSFIKGVHPEEKKIVTDRGFQCKDVFDILISVDSNVKTGFSVEKSFCTLYDFQSNAILEVYYIKGKNPNFTTDLGCKLLGKVNVEIPEPSKGERWIDVTFQFGMTELKVCAAERSRNISCTALFKLIE
ncbi:hypothetical protein CHS0354_004680 [Potamilus streckersoni]|uniref:Heat shock 70 kDa protein 12A n=1 Tax=Potamilus streckersoni TaxID=2493646 RepID=A0AAE0VSK2_9BIVA|nr:hypothetical protein CHS0354_004680 [Potamilus streckersoni]